MFTPPGGRLTVMGGPSLAPAPRSESSGQKWLTYEGLSPPGSMPPVRGGTNKGRPSAPGRGRAGKAEP